MREKLSLSIPILVEGKYDKNMLSQLVDATILTTDGFAVFNSAQKQAFLRRVCAERGLILLTDADGGGRQIRAFLLGILPRDKVHQVYIPKIEGKERRKRRPSRSGMLGVEGMEPSLLLSLLCPFADTQTVREPLVPITSARLYADGFSGRAAAAARRALLCERLSLPTDLSASALLEAINLLVGEAAYSETVAALFSENLT